MSDNETVSGKDIGMEVIHWITLGPHPNWVEVGRMILRDNPHAKLKHMSLKDIAEWFMARGAIAPQGGLPPESPITDSDYSELTGQSN